ncbi:MAG TPA: hypothetical protein VGP46_12535, partial [Acidimicrobiales bacterium]|nr:hypothetical protein [Acidimicrobiales bacterium]
GPLLGQYSQVTLAGGPPVHDLGPLEYWLLALPVHLDPNSGQLLGAAVLCAAAGVLTVEAARAVLGTLGSVAGSLLVLGSILWTPSIVTDPLWNPYFGDVFFQATIAAVFAALCANRRWWVVAVFTGSVAAQAHLMFALGSVALVVVSGGVLAVRAIRTKQRVWWLAQGLEVGVLCWLAPLYQELTGHPGNLTLLLRSEHGQRGNGLAFGLKAYAAATVPHPVWLGSSGGTAVLDRIDGSSPVVAAAVGVAILGSALLTRRNRPLASLALIACLLAIGLVVTYGGIPPSQSLSLAYLSAVLYPVGLLSCLAIGWGAASAVARWLPAIASRARSRLRPPGKTVRVVAGLVVVVLFTVAGQLRFRPPPAETHATVAAVELIARKIEATVPAGGPVDIRFNHPADPLQAVDYQSGVAWLVVGGGRSPRLGPFFSDWPQLESNVPTVLITVRPTGPSVRWTPAGSAPRGKHR